MAPLIWYIWTFCLGFALPFIAVWLFWIFPFAGPKWPLFAGAGVGVVTIFCLLSWISSQLH